MELKCTGKEFLEILFKVYICNKCPMVNVCHHNKFNKDIIYNACKESGEMISEKYEIK